ncbi:prepilin-type N-terminal cleavage/methylation domain-containing protein [Demequina sp.]|uniref:prepilin-type N-terminal cleavage/methylation domain-containing protein n=1 Tax=Demequina sp. TaxID=2050685 RepID=UPI003D109CD1
MIARIHKAMEKKDKGFTLIELLVVIIIIGILAAIAIPVFMNQRKKAVDTGVKSDLRTIANELETAYVDDQAYPATASGTAGVFSFTSTTAGAVTVQLSDDLTAVNYALQAGGESYILTGTNTKGDIAAGAGIVYNSADGGLAN